MRIEDRRVKQLRGKNINLVKVIWSDVSGDVTWELENKIREQYPHLFPGKQIFEDENSCCWGDL